MSATSGEVDAVSSSVRDGAVAVALGGASGIARALMSREPVSAGWIVRRALYSSFLGYTVNLVLPAYISSPGLAAATLALVCYFGTEIADTLPALGRRLASMIRDRVEGEAEDRLGTRSKKRRARDAKRRKPSR
jgi:hypothetical protein